MLKTSAWKRYRFWRADLQAGSATNYRFSRVTSRCRKEFDATFDANVVKRLTDVLVVSHENTAQIVDARPAPRFNAEADEPRPGLKRGHIPGR